MKNLILLFVLTLAACSTQQTTKPVVNNVPTTKPVVKEPVKVSMVNVLSYSGFTNKELTKASAYIPVMNKTIASKCFEDFMVRRNLIETNGKSRDQVVNDLRTKQVDIHLITYYKRFSKVAGYTYPNVNKIWLNRKYHGGASLCSEASNLAHELSHKLEYGHDYNATQSRPYTVPYSINAAFTVCCTK